ncbi:MAG: hopanoid-associated sugar epimerase [Phormidesmis sp.]
MKVFVTGGTGFVGANVVRLLLQEGHTVRALVRATSQGGNLAGLPVEKVESDLNDPQLWQKMQGCDALFHIAAHYSLWQADAQVLHESNVLGTRHCLAAAKRAGVGRTVYTSSVAAIGAGPAGKVVDETYQSPVEKLIGYYKKSKYWAEQEAIAAAKAGQDVVIVNPTSPIGEWDIKPTPTGDIILRFLQRKMPFYLNTGLNFVDVQDVAWGHLQAFQKGKAGERYILGNENVSLKELLDVLSQLTGLAAPASTIPAWIPLAVAWTEEKVLARLGKAPTVPIDGVRMASQKMYYDSTKAISELGMPQTPIRKALQREIDWFMEKGYA